MVLSYYHQLLPHQVLAQHFNIPGFSALFSFNLFIFGIRTWGKSSLLGGSTSAGGIRRTGHYLGEVWGWAEPHHTMTRHVSTPVYSSESLIKNVTRSSELNPTFAPWAPVITSITTPLKDRSSKSAQSPARLSALSPHPTDARLSKYQNSKTTPSSSLDAGTLPASVICESKRPVYNLIYSLHPALLPLTEMFIYWCLVVVPPFLIKHICDYRYCCDVLVAEIWTLSTKTSSFMTKYL